MTLKEITRFKRNPIRSGFTISILIIISSFFTQPILAAANYSYFFLPNSNYSQSDTLAVLRIGLGPTEPENPTRVDWLDPQGYLVSACDLGDCGPLFDQSVADNGALIWREFYFYISRQNRVTGTYTAVAYDHQMLPGGIFTDVEMFRVNFTIDSSAPATTPTPGPIGNLDSSFGTEGMVKTDFGGLRDTSNAVVIQDNGKIVVVGGSYNSSTDQSAFALARFDSDGSLDTGFGAGGKVNTLFDNAHWDDQAYAVALETNHKIVVAGTSEGLLALARYNSNGSLDTGFGTNGKVTNDSGEEGHAVAIQKDDKIVVVGVHNGSHFVLARYNSDGSLDTGFGSAGTMVMDFGGVHASANAIALQDDGKIVVVGYTKKAYPEKSYFALARLNRDGSLDAGFGAGGKVTTSLFQNGYGNAVVIQEDGRIVVGGASSVYSMGNIELTRYHGDGSLDTSFGVNGLVMTTFNGKLGIGTSLALLKNDKIVMAGYCEGASASPDNALTVFNSDGSLDTNAGLSNGSAAASSGVVRAMAVQDDGRIVVAGSSDWDTMLMRFVLITISRVYLPAINH